MTTPGASHYFKTLHSTFETTACTRGIIPLS